jgi:hypothetical protein
MLPGTENIDDLWADEVYEGGFRNMDPDRQRLYELCENFGVGITVMKAFAGGDILDEKLSPSGAALTVPQCISYALSRPAVSTVCTGARNTEQLKEQVLKTLRRAWIRHGAITLEHVYERAENVFDGYSLQEVDNQYLMSPFAGFRITGEMQIDEECDNM